MGAGKWRDTYTDALADRWIVCLGDHDPSGERHMLALCAEIHAVAHRCGIITLAQHWPDCPPKGDITDWLSACHHTPSLLGLGESSSADDIEQAAARLIRTWADAALSPAALRYARCFGVGPRGALILYQDRIADAVATERGLHYAGESWWQWQGTRWLELPVQRAPRVWIKDLIAAGHPQGSEAISSAVVSSIENLMADAVAIQPDSFNNHDALLLNLPNGMLHARTLEIIPHSPAHLSTVQLPVPYTPGAQAPRWTAWLEEMLPDPEVRDLMQEIFGYVLSAGKNFHKFFFFYGDGGTGKSTVADMLTALVGEDNTMALRMQDLDRPTERARLIGKRLYLAAELTKDSFRHIDMIKAITSGDLISVERKYKDGFSYRPQGKFILLSNVRAHTADTSDGFFRRLIQVNFTQQIPEDRKDYGLLDRLKEELPGILLWSLEGLRRLLDRGRFPQTRDSLSAAAQLQMHRASAKSFYEACITDTDPGGLDITHRYLTPPDIYAEYKTWCEWEHVNPYYETADSLMRELMNRVPSLRDRRGRQRDDEKNKWSVIYRGLVWHPWRGPTTPTTPDPEIFE